MRPDDRGTRTGLPALREISGPDYHADLVDPDRPTLSKSIIQLLIERSPAHARVAHPRLNPDFQRVDEDRFDLGTTAHSMFLEGIDSVDVIPYDDWRSKAAKELRDFSRSQGRIAMLAGQYDECCAMVAALREQCDAHPERFFTDGVAEKTLVWDDEYDALGRARLDWLRLDEQPGRAVIHDLKTTRASGSHESWSRTAISIGADLQAAWYLRGCEKALGFRPDFKFVVLEVAPPYLMSVFGIAPDALALADKKIEYALKKWATCLRNDDWPGYSQQTAYIEAPPWLEGQWLERELREAIA